ncbi:uncharacterized protein MICPUCDRAFT_58120 [Micromonas pusilla CCMP1545]|uniref:Predicted protein n=1 Tax=Micromonas pusilla (strain CCMP1545) TaxID=564608 RepID=C1MTM0_MICPC|nr:uncharacterized protein MICPUCDRAFT_58120 [Micromonas pusilla CCMP1545]EEH56972.1 predicted protein [Micromonas pusilla CCMP1545]|eukprot:XP_003058517.1 predicted protein [Micromonas pusilla CCMP1545]
MAAVERCDDGAGGVGVFATPPPSPSPPGENARALSVGTPSARDAAATATTSPAAASPRARTVKFSRHVHGASAIVLASEGESARGPPRAPPSLSKGLETSRRRRARGRRPDRRRPPNHKTRIKLVAETARVPPSPPAGFRFTKAERALLVSVFDKYHGDTPGRDTCAAIARAFSDSPVRNPERRDRRACERRRDRSRVSPLSVSPSSSLLSPSALYQTPTPTTPAMPATPATPATPTPTPVSSFTTSPIATPRGDDFFLSQRRARREDRAAEEKRRRRHSHDHPNAHLPGTISDAALLDADAPMFPSLMWNKLETEVDLTDLSDDDDDDDGGGGGGGGWGEFSGGSGSRIARGSSEWEDEWFVGAGDVALGLNEDEIEKLLASAPTPAEQDHERERDDGGADVKRSLSLPSMPLLLTPPAAVVAAKRAARADLEEWQPAGTSLYIGMIAHAGSPSHTRRQSSPSPPPPPPAEAPEIPYLPEPGKLLASEDHAAASILAADRSGDVVAAVEVESTDDWVAAAVRVEPAKERIRCVLYTGPHTTASAW